MLLTSTLEHKSSQMLLTSSWLAAIAYQTPSMINRNVYGRYGTSNLNIHHIREEKEHKTDTEIFVFGKKDTTYGSKGGVVVVSCRGSEPNSFADWIFTDFNLKQKRVFHAAEGDQRIHRGFLYATDAIWEGLMETLEKETEPFDKFTLLITGHSLGAALAVVIAARIKYVAEYGDTEKERDFCTKLTNSTLVHSFGQPRVGNPAFCEWYDSTLRDRTLRVVYGMDIVPRVPPTDGFWITGNQDWGHVGELAYFNREGVLSPDSDYINFNKLAFRKFLNPYNIWRSFRHHMPWHYQNLAISHSKGENHMGKTLEETSLVLRAIHSTKDFFIKSYVKVKGYFNKD